MRFPYRNKIINALAAAVPSTSQPTYISLKNVLRLAAIIVVKNGTGVTGSAITLKQATAVAGTGAKTLAFTKMLANLDTAANDTEVEVAVTGNTFTTLATNSKNALYIIDIPVDSLDTNNGFDCVAVGTGDATAATVAVLYIIEQRDPSAIGVASVLTD